jgi:hypothetical protein
MRMSRSIPVRARRGSAPCAKHQCRQRRGVFAPSTRYSFSCDGLRGYRVMVLKAAPIDRLSHDGRLDEQLSLPQDFVPEVGAVEADQRVTMNSLVYSTSAPFSACRPRARLIPSCAPERRQVFAGIPIGGRLRRSSPLKSYGMGTGPSICRPVISARGKRTAVSGATIHVAACGSREVVS